MNDVVFVMANSRLAKKKKGRRTHEDEFDDLSSDDDWVLDMMKKMTTLKLMRMSFLFIIWKMNMLEADMNTKGKMNLKMKMKMDR